MSILWTFVSILLLLWLLGLIFSIGGAFIHLILVVVVIAVVVDLIRPNKTV